MTNGSRFVWALYTLIFFAIPDRAAAVSVCQDVPAYPSSVTDTSGSGSHFTATGEATIMSDTADGLALAVDAAHLDARAALHDDRRVPKTGNGQLQGVREARTCRHDDKIFVTVMWDLKTAQQAAELSSAMKEKYEPTPDTEKLKKPDLDWSIFNRSMH